MVLPAHDGTVVDLAQRLRAGAAGLPPSAGSTGFAGVVVYFYPAAMTPGCTTQACDFRDSLASLQGAGYDVLGVSPDPVQTLRDFVEQDAITFDLLSDPDHSTMIAWGTWGEKLLHEKAVTGVLRSTFVVAPDGTLAFAKYNVQATGHVTMLRRELGLG